MNKIINFWKQSYSSHPIAFWFEMVSAITVIIGSGILTYTVLDPRPDIFIPFYWIGSSTGFVVIDASVISKIFILLCLFNYKFSFVIIHFSVCSKGIASTSCASTCFCSYVIRWQSVWNFYST